MTRLGPPGSAVLRPLMWRPAVPLTWRFPIAGTPEVSTAGPAPIAGNPKIARIRRHTYDFCPWCRRRQGAFRVVGVGGRSCHVRWPRGNDTAGQVDCECNGGNQRAGARFVHHRCSLKALRRAQCKRTLHRSVAVAYDLMPCQASWTGSEWRGAAEPMTLTGKPMCALLHSIPDQTGNARQSNRSAAHFQSMNDCIPLQPTDNVSLICGKRGSSSGSGGGLGR